jgi:Rieske Fe-S protein
MQDTDQDSGTNRRVVIAGVGAAGVAVALTACGSSSSSSGGSTNSGSTGGASQTIKTTDIPVGGGKIYDQLNVVVTQPASGQYKAFSTVCTHAGCQVSAVKDGTIDCPCHGSKFSVTDGSVTTGPAASPLPAKTVSVSGDTITVS